MEMESYTQNKKMGLNRPPSQQKKQKTNETKMKIKRKKVQSYEMYKSSLNKPNISQ